MIGRRGVRYTGVTAGTQLDGVLSKLIKYDTFTVTADTTYFRVRDTSENCVVGVASKSSADADTVTGLDCSLLRIDVSHIAVLLQVIVEG